MLPCKMSGSCGVIIITSFERSEVKRVISAIRLTNHTIPQIIITEKTEYHCFCDIYILFYMVFCT